MNITPSNDHALLTRFSLASFRAWNRSSLRCFVSSSFTKTSLYPQCLSLVFRAYNFCRALKATNFKMMSRGFVAAGDESNVALSGFGLPRRCDLSISLIFTLAPTAFQMSSTIVSVDSSLFSIISDICRQFFLEYSS